MEKPRHKRPVVPGLSVLAAVKEKADKLEKKANAWVACLARVFEVFPLICPSYKVELSAAGHYP